MPRIPFVSGTPGITGLPVAHQAITEALHIELPHVAFPVGAFGFLEIQVDEVQMVPDGFGFHIQASEYTWITLVFETKPAAETAHGHAAKAVANATAVKIVNR